MYCENKPKHPDYKSKEGVSIWKNRDKNGKVYLTVRVLGLSINCFKNEKPKEQEDDF